MCVAKIDNTPTTTTTGNNVATTTAGSDNNVGATTSAAEGSDVGIIAGVTVAVVVVIAGVIVIVVYKMKNNGQSAGFSPQNKERPTTYAAPPTGTTPKSTRHNNLDAIDEDHQIDQDKFEL